VVRVSCELNVLNLGLSFDDLGVFVSNLDLKPIITWLHPACLLNGHLECVSFHASEQVLRVNVGLIFLVGRAEHHVESKIAIGACAQVHVFHSESRSLNCNFWPDYGVKHLSTVVH
jgi:hypothetical protein